MSTTNSNQAIRERYAKLIHAAVEASRSGVANLLLERGLEQSAENGWIELVAVIRAILRGERGREQLAILEGDDHVIATAILDALDDPATLPPLHSGRVRSGAAPRIAVLIHAIKSGQPGTAELLDGMLTLWRGQGGEMAALATAVEFVRDGERDSQQLCLALSAKSCGVIQDLLDELQQLSDAELKASSPSMDT